MKKSILIVVLSLVAGFAVGAWSTSVPESGDPDPGDSALAMGPESAASAEERLAARLARLGFISRLYSTIHVYGTVGTYSVLVHSRNPLRT